MWAGGGCERWSPLWQKKGSPGAPAASPIFPACNITNKHIQYKNSSSSTIKTRTIARVAAGVRVYRMQLYSIIGLMHFQNTHIHSQSVRVASRSRFVFRECKTSLACERRANEQLGRPTHSDAAPQQVSFVCGCVSLCFATTTNANLRRRWRN